MVVWLVEVRDPLGDVSGHVDQVLRGRAVSEGADGSQTHEAVRAVGVVGRERSVVAEVGVVDFAPWVVARGGAAGRELPLRLCREPAPCPCAVGLGVLPPDVGYGQEWTIESRIAGEEARWTAGAGRHAA